MDGQEPIMIFGRVTRGDGGPLSGAALTLCDLAGDQLDRATADEGGHYQLVPPTGGTYLVICSSSTHQPKASLVALTDRPLRHDVGLSGGGATLTGTVGARSGSNGSATMRGAEDVVLTLTDVRGSVVAVARTGADGTYSFTDLAEGVYTLTAAASSVSPVAETVQVPAEGQTTHDLALSTSSELRGFVRSATAGRPVPEALTTLVSADGNVVGSAVTSEDGSFLFDDVAEGVYTITASGYAPVASEIDVGAGHPSDVVLTLTPPTVEAPSRGGAGDGYASDGYAGGHDGHDGYGRNGRGAHEAEAAGRHHDYGDYGDWGGPGTVDRGEAR